MSIYDNNFYENIDQGALRSARIIVPEIIKIFNPKNVIDIGCGTGAWLSAFVENGVYEILGIDGEYNTFAPSILKDNYISHDLSNPLVVDKKYDLAITFEVAEHIDESFADIFVSNLCSCSDNIVWSAAVPGQRGLNHVNEQWPSYWISKFTKLGFSCNGSFRFKFWFNNEIETWYKQNILLFSKSIIWSEEVRDLIHHNNYSNYSYVEDIYKYDN